MPIYEYSCHNCGNIQEVLHKVNETLALACTRCGQEGLKRAVTRPCFRLGGKGYYETDEKPAEKQRHLAGCQSEAVSCQEKQS